MISLYIDFSIAFLYTAQCCFEGGTMTFYQKLQLDPFVLKKQIHNSVSKNERQKLFLIMLLRSVLIVAFAIAFISAISYGFGMENSFLAVILFCMLLSLRFVHFGYKISHSIVSLGIIFAVLFSIPLIFQLENIYLKFVLNLINLLLLLFLTGKEPQMGNPGLYSFSYIFLLGTSVKLSPAQLNSRFWVLLSCFILFAVIFFQKHRHKDTEVSISQSIFDKGIASMRNIWLAYYAIGSSLVILLSEVWNLPRAMWVGFAFSSIISTFDFSNSKIRVIDRMVGVIAGSILFMILVNFIPKDLLGIIGGVCLGLSATYRFKNVFNCFGALALAFTIFSGNSAVAIRIFDNLVGVLLAVVYVFIWKLLLRWMPVELDGF